MTHVARNANYQGSLTTPVPSFWRRKFARPLVVTILTPSALPSSCTCYRRSPKQKPWADSSWFQTSIHRCKNEVCMPPYPSQFFLALHISGPTAISCYFPFSHLCIAIAARHQMTSNPQHSGNKNISKSKRKTLRWVRMKHLALHLWVRPRFQSKRVEPKTF